MIGRKHAWRRAVTGALGVFLVGSLFGTYAFAQRTQVTYAFWGGETELELSRQLKEQFEAANPDIEVKLQQVNSNEYEQKLLIQIASGTAPDVMVIRDASSVFFARRGLYADLNPLIESHDVDLSVFDPQTLEAYQLDGEQYGLPRSVTPVLTYYNEKMFDDAGVAYPEEDWTWDDFLAAAQALTRDTDGDGKTDQWGTFMVPWDALFLPIVYSYGGNIMNEDGTEATMLQPETVAAFEFANDLINEHHVAPPVEEAEAFNWIDGWAQQKYAMIFQGRWATPIFLDAMEESGAQFEFDVAPIPQGALRSTVQYSDALGILKSSEAPDAAFMWIEFLTGEEGQQTLGGPRSLVVPANLNVAQTLISPDVLPENASLFISEAEYGAPPPQSPSFSALYEIVNRNLREVFLGLQPVEEGLSRANEEVNTMVEQSYESLQ
jgi:multiple sugar transport system substrate-binding protein